MDSEELLAAAEAISIAEGIDEFHGLMKVLLNHLSVLPIPPEIQSSLRTADAYWNGDSTVNANDLESARLNTWEYLDSFPTGADLKSREGRTARALLCVTQPDGDIEIRSMKAEWFAAMIWNES
ncbi:hypothetical protein ACIPY0_07365 [Paenarthrobacter nicotinovorans]|uniref:hypothetical protein n=1 Tax=Paenarthrobacter nicotinovorans TaxID=29320 RepID=UPI002785D465|nr:hypothetical protein [Paenarthrobacter nicotinovorans]MDP9937235.1 hypothetical protein [Paenarthrobacter nicotinovorans]